MVLDFGLISSGLFPSSDASGDGLTAPIVNQVIWKDVGIGIVPIKSIVAWCKTLGDAIPLLPNFVECNGQVLDDGDSPLDGQTIPDFNGDNRFLRGNATSGGVGGIETIPPNQTFEETGGTDNAFKDDTGLENRPPFYNVVWIMRVK